jgi:nucleotide-binding universal stress UspA family protein
MESRPATAENTIMNKLCRILVPKNFSPYFDAALDYATSLAHRVGATIDVLHVWDIHATAPRTGLHALFFADSDDGMALERLLSRKRRSKVEIRGRVEVGELSETIVRVATQDHFDLVVIGRSDRTSSSPRISDDFANQLAHAVRCPVVSVSATMVREFPEGASWLKAAPRCVAVA